MQHGCGTTAIISRHRVEIEVQPETGVFLVDETTLGAEVLIALDDLISGDGVGDASDRDVPTLLAVDPLANGSVSFIGHEDLARCGGRLKPRCEVHATADDRIVHPILAAEVADGAVSSVDSDPALKRLFDSRCPPHILQLTHPFAHGDGHPNAGEGVLIDTARLRITKEDDNSVTNILVDRRSIREGDLRHFG